MKKNLLLFLILTSMSFSLFAENVLQQILPSQQFCPKTRVEPTNEIRDMLQKEATGLSTAVINKVMTILKCANQYNLDHRNILTVIDYSLPANQKRLWVFDLEDKKLLFYTYVSHGIKSGALLSTLFSNKYDSKSSSIGVYKTEQTYYGRDGLSLRLAGLDSGFNNNASNRYIVMHGGWYVEEKFIQKYGRSGRSWGCPAVPLEMTAPIINTIKDNSLMIVYYPDDDWFSKSRFLKCDKLTPIQDAQQLEMAANRLPDDTKKRDDVLLLNIHKSSKSEENTAVAVISAEDYERTFNIKPPLGRMLRRQINNMEYIALSTTEFESLIANNDKSFTKLSEINFAKPVIKMIRGYYETQMQILNLGKIKDVAFSPNTSKTYTITFDTKNSVILKATDQFIRWLGL